MEQGAVPCSASLSGLIRTTTCVIKLPSLYIQEYGACLVCMVLWYQCCSEAGHTLTLSPWLPSSWDSFVTACELIASPLRLLLA